MGALQEEAINREWHRRARTAEALPAASPICYASWFGGRGAVGLAEDHAIQLPLTQVELADTLGLTAVHLNRILPGFRRDNLIGLARHRLTLLDVERLQKIAGFNQDYLHRGVATTEVRSYIDTLERNRREVC